MHTGSLQGEEDEVSPKEEPCHFVAADYRVIVSVYQFDNAPKGHIYRCSEASWRHQDEGIFE